MKNLPIGIQDFYKIREFDGIYVDKTHLIHQMIANGTSYFLSRPRRFGKSLTVSVLQELFEGNKALFKDLWIENNWDWSNVSPVIRISFAEWDYHELGLPTAIMQALDEIAQKRGIVLTKTTVKSRFRELLYAVYEQAGRVVLLIDEYDKPIVQYLENEQLKRAIANQETLKSFYSVLKDADKIMRFVFITGISKFTKVSIFSDLNQLIDLTLIPQYAALTGYTQEELELNFAEHLQAVAAELNISLKDLLTRMKQWYNGYTWDGKTQVYNPFGTLNFLLNRVFKNYWFSTGTPTFLLEQMKAQGNINIKPVEVHSTFFEKYDLEDLDITLLFFQTGYLTIKKIDRLADNYWLDYPNKEVHDSIYAFLMNGLTSRSQKANSGMTMKDLSIAFEIRNLERIKLIINTYLAELPHEVYRHSSEGLYHGLIHIIFTYLGTMINSEVHSSYGQADAVVQTETDVFIFEFKFNETADAALQQINEKGYADKYRASGKTLTAIGVNFKEGLKTIEEWKTALL